MKKDSKVQGRQKFLLAVLTLALTAALWLIPDGFSIVSHAESQGKVTATSANIRKEPNSTSTVIGSTEKDKIIAITSQVKGSDGYTWYQTFVNSETLGYIRSDLVTIIDGTTPATVTPVPATTTTPTTTTTTTTASNNETPAEVSPVNPVSATVSGSSNVNVRSNASTSSAVVKKVSSGLALTVTGTAQGKDGKTWYKVSFSADGSEVEGFIRSDYVKLSEELTPYTEPEVPETPPETDPEPDEPETPEVVKDFDTRLEEDGWYLLDMQKNEKHNIQGLFEKVEQNLKAYEEEVKTTKAQKAVIIVLVLLLVAAAAAVALLIFKIREMADAAYISEVERETMKRRGTARTQGGSQKVMHTVGSGSQTARPAGQRPSGAQGTGQRPAGARPAGTQGSGQRPAGTQGGGQRPAGTQGSGQRPAGAQGSGQRPAGAQGGGQRPAGTQGSGQRPAGAQGSSQRPAGAQGSSQRPAGAQQGSGQGQKSSGNQQGWQSKNFMAEDDDEFEFEFLNYDGDEE
ncbi:MAG: SH3 domain-containing protein [bacterium]|nr:SH3 domain-containing protein [bacterium]